MADISQMIELFKHNLTLATNIKLLSPEVKTDILNKYGIMADAYFDKAHDNGKLALEEIKNNVYTFSVISHPIVYTVLSRESTADYYSKAKSTNSNLAKMLYSLSSIKNVIDHISIDKLDSIDIADISKALETFGIETADSDLLTEEEIKELEAEMEAAAAAEAAGFTGDEFDTDEDTESADGFDTEDFTDSSEPDDTSLSDKEIRKKYENAFGGRIDGPINSMLATLDNLYRSSFESMPQVGILINNDSNPLIFMGSDGKEKVKSDRNTAIDFAIFDTIKSTNQEFAYVANIQGDGASESDRVIPKLEVLTKQKCVLYKLHLQFQTAYISACKGDTSIRRWITETQLSDGKYTSADDWLQKCNFGKTTKLQKFSDVKKWYKWSLENIIYNMLIENGIQPVASNQMAAMEVVDILFKSLKNVVVVADRKMKKGNAVDTELRISTDSILDGNIVASNIANNLNIGNSTDIEVRPTKYANGVLTLNVIFDKAEANKANLFASEVLNNILESGNAPSWNHALLGKNPDGSYLFWDDFMDPGKANPYKRCYTIYAASRSGKGVMTSTLVASALCDDKQIFYTDGKPENGACLGEIAWSCGKEAYVFNGTPEGAVPYSGDMEAYTNGVRDVREIYSYATNLPKKLFESGHFTKADQRKFLGVMRYLKSMMLCSETIIGRAKGILPKDKWQVWIFDEMTKMSSNEKDIRKKFLDYAGDKVKVKKISDSDKTEYLTAIVADEKLKKALDKNAETYDEGIEYLYKWLNWCNYIKSNMKSAAVIELGKADTNLIFIFQEASWIPEDCNITTIGAVVDSLDSTKIVGNGGIQPLCKDYGDGTTKGPWVDKINSGTGWWAISNDANIRNGNVKLFKPFNVFTTKLAPDGTKSKEPFSSEEEKLHYMDGYARKLLSAFGKNPEDILNEAYNYGQTVVTSLEFANTLKEFIYDCSNLSTGKSDNKLEEVGTDANGNPIVNSSGVTQSLNITEDEEPSIDLGTPSGNQSRFTPTQQGMSQSAMSDVDNATAKRPTEVRIMPFSYFSKLDERSKQVNMERASKELINNKFNTYVRSNTKFGLKHLCWNISILHGCSMIDTNLCNPSIKDFATNYCMRIDNGQFEYDYIPNEEEVNVLNIKLDGIFTGDGSVEATSGSYSNIAQPTFSEAGDFEPVPEYDGTTMHSAPRERQAFSQNPAGRNNIDTAELLVPPIKLDSTNSIDIDPSSAKVNFMAQLTRSLSGASYLCTQRTKSVVDAIIKAMKDKKVVKRVSITGYKLVVNGRLVDTDPLISDEYGIRFEDFVIVKEILKAFPNIEHLVLDNDMFNQVVMTYGDDAQSIWRIFQENSKLNKIEVQYAAGSEYKTITRQDFRNQAAEIQSEAKKSKWKQQVEAVSASHHPRLAEKGIGYSKSSFEVAESMGSNFKKQLTQANPNLFKAGLYGSVAVLAGITGAIIGIPSKIGMLFKR